LPEVAVVRMSDDARDLWKDFADRQGVTVAGLLEAMAVVLPPEGAVLDPRMVAVIEEAQAIDVERRRRG
jgi:hypothetical protein